VALFVSYVTGALLAAPLLFSKKKTMESAIPFGTFLAVGTFVALLWGNGIAAWYGSLLAL
jgi:leader peptidase (prepilin peptidase)/N-methyltransferase